eukprot:TRINITY_DN98716_c0_g1_i1.p1 TRINITY_DN98716_c0_g1~~TRINITY_DN98716_c0_g1_i1.p1  ORF type:complete len:119 (-),score=38.34 TRINITY_DN98716_c0_g1_i1:48-404(-)
MMASRSVAVAVAIALALPIQVFGGSFLAKKAEAGAAGENALNAGAEGEVPEALLSQMLEESVEEDAALSLMQTDVKLKGAKQVESANKRAYRHDRAAKKGRVALAFGADGMMGIPVGR